MDLNKFMTVEAFQEEIASLKSILAQINKIADDANRGVNAADWRKDWQRNEWAKVRNLSSIG
jgi:hypothetical protein